MIFYQNLQETDLDMSTMHKPVCILEVRLGLQTSPIRNEVSKSILNNLSSVINGNYLNQEDAEAKMGSLSCVFSSKHHQVRDELAGDRDRDEIKPDWNSSMF